MGVFTRIEGFGRIVSRCRELLGPWRVFDVGPQLRTAWRAVLPCRAARSASPPRELRGRRHPNPQRNCRCRKLAPASPRICRKLDLSCGRFLALIAT